ncbi:hypothetical protein KCU59_g106, partial [Aureobasidium melanogenum]
MIIPVDEVAEDVLARVSATLGHYEGGDENGKNTSKSPEDGKSLDHISQPSVSQRGDKVAENGNGNKNQKCDDSKTFTHEMMNSAEPKLTARVIVMFPTTYAHPQIHDKTLLYLAGANMNVCDTDNDQTDHDPPPENVRRATTYERIVEASRIASDSSTSTPLSSLDTFRVSPSWFLVEGAA